MRARIAGEKELLKALNKYRSNLGTKFRLACQEAAGLILAKTSPLVPFETEALKNSDGWFQVGRGWDTETIVGFGFEVTGYRRKGRQKDQEPRLYAVRQHGPEYPNKRQPGTINFYFTVGIDQSLESVSDLIYSYVAK